MPLSEYTLYFFWITDNSTNMPMLVVMHVKYLYKERYGSTSHTTIESHMGIQNEQLTGQVKYQPQSNSFLYFSFIPLWIFFHLFLFEYQSILRELEWLRDMYLYWSQRNSISSNISTYQGFSLSFWMKIKWFKMWE